MRSRQISDHVVEIPDGSDCDFSRDRTSLRCRKYPKADHLRPRNSRIAQRFPMPKRCARGRCDIENLVFATLRSLQTDGRKTRFRKCFRHRCGRERNRHRGHFRCRKWGPLEPGRHVTWSLRRGPGTSSRTRRCPSPRTRRRPVVDARSGRRDHSAAFGRAANAQFPKGPRHRR